MFTGLVEEVGTITRIDRRGESAHLSIRANKVLTGTAVGDSIAVSGTCLTVVAMGSDHFTVEIMPETLARSTLGAASSGTSVNLERSLALGARLGGHLVLGHVDAVATVLSVRAEGIAQRVRLSLPPDVAPCVAAKGSIAVDGISLTVVDVQEESFSVGIIPHTLKETTLRAVRAGVQVNLEADVLARYVLRTLESLSAGWNISGGAVPASPGSVLTEDFLRDQGFA